MSERKKIIIIDDNIDFINELTSYLTKSNLNVIGTYNNPVNALKDDAVSQCDLILTDIIMPNVDGITFLETIRNNENNPHIIVISAINKDSVLRKALDYGADYFLIKPIAFDVLVRRINDFFSMNGGAPSASKEHNTDYFQVSQGNNYTQGIKAVEPVQISDKAIISKTLCDIGVTPNLKGYQYLREAISIIKDDFSKIKGITQVIYPQIAEKYDSKPIRVERAIRHAIEVAWNKGRIDTIDMIFGNTVDVEKSKPTNSEFIAMIADYIALKKEA